jgi:hypothetical protein
VLCEPRGRQMLSVPRRQHGGSHGPQDWGGRGG